MTGLRVAIVCESALTAVNGVTTCVRRTLDYLLAAGHEAMVVAPGPPYPHCPVPQHPVRAVPLPFYPSFRVGATTARYLTGVLADYQPDVVHLASPALLGRTALTAARRLGLPTVAVFQTDLAGFARRHRLGALAPALWRELRRLHNAADLTLAPSTFTLHQLGEHGIAPLARWRRGVDTTQFNPAHRSPSLRRSLAPGGETIIGYVGRLAIDKRVHMLRAVADLPGTRLVVTGDGPAGPRLRRLLPEAVFTGTRCGPDLSALVASLDVFVHTGADDTFCQAAQEALAAGVPVVAPAIGGPLDLVRHGGNGYLYPPDDPGRLRAAVHRLVEDGDARTVMGGQARRSVLHSTWTAVGDELLGHYARVARTALPAHGVS